MFSVFCFSEIGIDFLKITLKENMIPENLFACSSDKKGNKETMRNLCSKNNIKYIEMKKGVDPFIYVKDNINIKELNSKIILLWWPHILKKNLIQNITNIVNIHPSYLPFGKGKYGYIWAIQDNTKYGASIHFVDENIDTGEIICQNEITIEPNDTGESLYKKGVIECKKLYKHNCKNIINNNIKSFKSELTGDYHSKKDFRLFNDNAEKKLFTLREAIDFLRARTFKEGTGSKGYEITYQNKLYNVQISIIKTEEK